MLATDLSSHIKDYIDKRRDTKLNPLQKKLQKSLAEAKTEAEAAALNADFQELSSPMLEKFNYRTWLDNAAMRAGQITFATHAPKYLHPDAKGTSYLFNGTQSEPGYVTSAALNKPELDVVGNAAVLDVAGLLRLSDGNNTLAEQIQANNGISLQHFAADQDQLDAWLKGLKAAFVSGEPSTCNRVKQVYFPIDTEQNYHMLVPLFATSLADAVHTKVQAAKFSEAQIALRQARREGRFAAGHCLYFPRLAIQKFGGSNAQNISQFNKKRGGFSYLFPSMPPNWTSQTPLPLGTKSFFNPQLYWQVKADIQALKDYFRAVPKQVKNRKFRQHRDNVLLGNIIFAVLQVAAGVQKSTQKTAWTTLAECQLPLAQRVWLDPSTQTDEYQAERQSSAWQKRVAGDFALWLNQQLQSKKLVYGVKDTAHWAKHFLRELQHFPQAQLEGASR